jgi:hypothetical protein
MNAFLKNLTAIILPALLCLLLLFTLNTFSSLKSLDAFWSILFFLGISLILHVVYSYNAGKENFTGLLISGIVIKLLLALSVIAFYAFVHPEDFLPFSLQFIAQYILFTIFEIRFLIQLIKQHTYPPAKP